MRLTVLLAATGLVLSIAPARAGDASAEIDFVTRASIANLVAIAESRLALSRATDPKVKAFASRLIRAHEIAESALQEAAEHSGAAPSTMPDPVHQARLTALQSKFGGEFDKAYVADQAQVHSNALTLYGDYMLLGDNAKLKALAIKMIPTTEAQFKTAQALSGD